MACRSLLLIGAWTLIAAGCSSARPDKITPQPTPAVSPSPSMSATPVMTAAEYAAAGQAACRRGAYEEAVAPLRRALEMEKEESSLSKDAWTKLIFDLTDAMEKTGRIEDARVVVV